MKKQRRNKKMETMARTKYIRRRRREKKADRRDRVRKLERNKEEDIDVL